MSMMSSESAYTDRGVLYVCVYVAHPVLSFTSWFHGKISGPEAVCKLQPAEDGLFLVRESIRHPGDYVLCVSVSGEVIHYRVIYKENKLTIDNMQYFYNLIDMIEVRSSCFLEFRPLHSLGQVS